MEIHRRTIMVDGLETSYLEAGQGQPIILLHGGEFGASAEIGWEKEYHRLDARQKTLTFLA